MMRYHVGIDEVGRGSLAGPVAVAAVCLPSTLRLVNSRLGTLRDSKKLSVKQRDAWFRYVAVHPKVRYAVARVYPRTIDRANISNAANLAALRAYRKLVSHIQQRTWNVRIYLDGSLYLGSKNWQVGNSMAKTVRKGDEKYTSVKLASIMAKVSRDGYMVRLAKKYPAYKFDVHKGYGTRLHRSAIEKHGPSKVHRLTFIGNYHKI